jgi:nitroreductase
MVLELLRKRRSIRKFTHHAVTPEILNQLVEAGLRAPSSKGLASWEFVVVTDRNLLEKLASAKPHGSSFLREAPLAIVVCGRPARSDMWIENCSIAATLILLAAGSLGLGACWIQIRGRAHDDSRTAGEYISEVLDIPGDVEVESIIAAGYPDEEKPGHDFHKLPWHKVHRNRFGGGWAEG